jgi:hypothetical protein
MAYVSNKFALHFWSDTCYVMPFSNARLPKEPFSMEWTTPQHEEIDLNCEVSSYANAEL